MFQDKLQSFPTLVQGHLRVFWDSVISHIKGEDPGMNLKFTYFYLAKSCRFYLDWGIRNCFTVILDLEKAFRANDQVITDTLRLVLNKADEALIISKAAMSCLEYLCHSSFTDEHVQEHLQILGVDRNYRKTQPWRWHQQRSCRGLARKVIVQHGLFNNSCRYSLTTYGKLFSRTYFGHDKIYPLHSLPWIHWNFCNNDHQAKPFYQYRGYLEYLVILLPCAGRFSPLIHLCKTKAFVPMSMMFPDRSRKARHAIAAYLNRIEAEIIENHTV